MQSQALRASSFKCISAQIYLDAVTRSETAPASFPLMGQLTINSVEMHKGQRCFVLIYSIRKDGAKAVFFFYYSRKHKAVFFF